MAPLFAALAFTEAEAHRRKMAFKGTLIPATILLLFTLSGDWLLAVLGTGLPAFRSAGGVLLFCLALDMMIVALLTLSARLEAGRMMNIIGVTGSGVASRVLGILLAALAVQFVLDGPHTSFG